MFDESNVRTTNLGGLAVLSGVQILVLIVVLGVKKWFLPFSPYQFLGVYPGLGSSGLEIPLIGLVLATCTATVLAWLIHLSSASVHIAWIRTVLGIINVAVWLWVVYVAGLYLSGTLFAIACTLVDSVRLRYAISPETYLVVIHSCGVMSILCAALAVGIKGRGNRIPKDLTTGTLITLAVGVLALVLWPILVGMIYG
ncbi:MAG: hypothetical protein LBG99_09005 [Propionibacteriaceae bacterium]|nr:hypothetical protein [Propionibacteriaceae bacterium]